MAKVLDARSAAHEIRGRMKQPSPEDQHIESFVGKVLDELGLEHTMNNAAMVARALHDADIQPHRIDEYPKAVTVKAVDEKKYGDDKEHDVVHVVQNEDEEQRVLNGEQPGPAPQNEYPKSIRVRGTDGNWRNQLVRDLKEEREFRGVGASAIDPEASTQYKKAMLEHPTQDEIDVAKVTSRGGEMQKEALDNVNEPKVGGGTNLANPPDAGGDDGDYTADEGEPYEPPAPPSPEPPAPPPRRSPPKRA